MEDIEVATTCLNIYTLFYNQIIMVLCSQEYLINERYIALKSQHIKHLCIFDQLPDKKLDGVKT